MPIIKNNAIERKDKPSCRKELALHLYREVVPLPLLNFSVSVGKHMNKVDSVYLDFLRSPRQYFASRDVS